MIRRSHAAIAASRTPDLVFLMGGPIVGNPWFSQGCDLTVTELSSSMPIRCQTRVCKIVSRSVQF